MVLKLLEGKSKNKNVNNKTLNHHDFLIDCLVRQSV